MKYKTPASFRNALEQRLLNMEPSGGADLERLRRQVLYERVAVRLNVAEPGSWIIKGGVALELRLGNKARTTKDLDLGLRQPSISEQELTHA
jgi:hypothetical protein